ncbi:hypothetical protein B1F69_15405 [Pseudomonas syringae]|nr:hypothetical protein B1F74_11340 [Pseudomonas syringae]RXT90652.1 hypothetical protein B1F69_15405 [Pseudomonas syringae]
MGDAPRHDSAPRPRTQGRKQSVQNGIPMRSMGTIVVVRGLSNYFCDFRQSRSVKSLRMSAMRLSSLARCSGVLRAVMSTISDIAAFSVWS